MTPTLRSLMRLALLMSMILVLACSEEGAAGTKAQADKPQGNAPAASSQAAEDDSAYQMAPDFALPTVQDGKTFRLSEQRGKVVLVDFWATWCGPCRMEIPHLIELYEENKKAGFVLVGVSLDQQGPAVVKPFAKSWKMSYPVVVDQLGETARAYGGIRSIPTTLLVDRKGRVINAFVGYHSKEQFEEAIHAALGKS